MESKAALSMITVMTILIFSPIIAFSDSDIQSIDAEINLNPYDDNRVELDIRFFDEKNLDVRQINYHIIVTQDGKKVHEEIVYDADGKGTHITSPLESFSHIEITIKVKGLGLAQPYSGPTNELFFAKSITTHYFTAYSDKSSYSTGDTMRIYGNTGTSDDNIVSMIIKSPSSDLVYIKQATVHNQEFSFDLIASGETWNESGNYVATVANGNSNVEVEFWFDDKTTSSNDVDTVAPLLIIPDNLIINTQESNVTVDYTVKAIDDIDGILEHVCNPMSGSVFSLGDTLVTCGVMDSAKNYVQKKFTVSILNDDNTIPSWIKDVAGFWCMGEINDAGFIEGIQYLIENNVIVMPKTTLDINNSVEIPNWVKNNACWWSEGVTSDDDFTSAIGYLISNGIIQIS